MKTSDFYYELPEELIAQTAAEPRDSSRLLVYNRENNKTEHSNFRDIIEYLKCGDVLVINNTRVIKARLYGIIEGKGVKTETLLLKRLNLTDWEAIVRPARRLKADVNVIYNEELSSKVISIGESGIRVLRFYYDGVFEDILSRVGRMPLPPYITTELSDESRYQTVYGYIDGSAAAPTAGLHFTEELLKRIREKGIIITEILLHIGLSTFRPVKAQDIKDHVMHNEYYEISKQAADIINRAKAENRRVIAVGTTSVRTLESAADINGVVLAGSGQTDIFIYPPYNFKVIDCLITNFHLPESTLIMLVSAFAGLEETIKIYTNAVKERYRFFSFGDSMFII